MVQQEQHEASVAHKAALQELQTTTTSTTALEESLGEMCNLHDQLLMQMLQSQHENHALRAALSKVKGDNVELQTAMTMQQVCFLFLPAGVLLAGGTAHRSKKGKKL